MALGGFGWNGVAALGGFGWLWMVFLMADSPFFSTIVLFNNQPFSPGLRRFSRKQDRCKKWKWKVPLEFWMVLSRMGWRL